MALFCQIVSSLAKTSNFTKGYNQMHLLHVFGRVGSVRREIPRILV